ncbi:Ig-like domain-containing protein [Flavobacterium sp.]
MQNTTHRVYNSQFVHCYLFLLLGIATTSFGNNSGDNNNILSGHKEFSALKKEYKTVVMPPPNITAQPSPADYDGCINTIFLALHVTATEATTYQWYKNTTATNSGGNLVGNNTDSYVPRANSAGLFYYYCVVSNDGGSVASEASGGFTTFDYPSAGEIEGIQNICSNGTTTFNSTGDAGGYWTSQQTGIATIDYNTGIITPVSLGTATIYYTALGASNCPNSKALRKVFVTNTLSAGVLSGNQHLCTETDAIFTSSGNADGAWTSSDSVVATVNLSTGIITPLNEGSLTITYTVAVEGCASETATRTATVAVLPNTGILSGYENICTGGTTTFTNDGETGGVWFSEDTDVATIAPTTGFITSVSAGIATMTYTLTGNGGCANVSDSRDAVVSDALAPAEIEGTQNVCSGHFAKDLALTNYGGDVIKWQTAASSDFAIPTDIEITDDVLSGSNLGVINATTYVRALIGNECGSVYSATAILTAGESTTWDGSSWSNGVPTITKKAIIAGLYNTASAQSFEACSCDVLATGQLIIEANTYVLLNQELYNNNIVTIKNNGSLVQIDDAALNTEAVTVERHTTLMRRFDFTYWSSPVSGETLANLATNTVFYRFNTAANNWLYIGGSTVMEQGIGYIARAPQSFSTTVPAIYTGGKFIGRPNNGIFTVAVDASEGNKWNLIGNPYPSALNVEEFLSLNTNELESTVFLWTHNTPSSGFQYSSSDYASYNASGGIKVCDTCPVPSNFIASGQAFFVGAKTAGTVTFNNSMRSVAYDNAQFFRTALATVSEKNRFWLNLTNEQGAFKQVLMSYTEDATNEFDSKYDGENFNANSFINFYSINDDKNLSIQGRALPFMMSEIIPLGYSTSVAGLFSINLDNVEGLFTTQEIYLKDNLTQTIHDIKEAPYIFNTTVGTYNSRFELLYQASPTLTSSTFDISNVVVYKSNEQIIVNTGSTVMEKVKIFDIRGRLLFEQNKINQTQATFPIGNLKQILLVQITSESGIIVTKKTL